MRNSRKNKTKFYYSSFIGKEPIYATDKDGNRKYTTDTHGNKYYQQTGEYRSKYSAPTEFYASISMSGGEAESVEFGLNLADYNAILSVPNNYISIDETALIWHKTMPVIDKDGNVDIYSADYNVVKINESKNQTKYILKKIVK